VAGLGDEEGFGFFGEEDEYSYVFWILTFLLILNPEMVKF
jgi:hypothetical protein